MIVHCINPIHTDSQVPLGYTYIGKAGKPVDV